MFPASDFGLAIHILFFLHHDRKTHEKTTFSNGSDGLHDVFVPRFKKQWLCLVISMSTLTEAELQNLASACGKTKWPVRGLVAT
jgi:hypothetical protein